MKRLLAITALLLASLYALPAQTDTAARSQRDAIYDNIDSYARKVRKDWNIPGYALAVVKDGEVVLAKGYGEKMRGKKNPVDANTVFQIGSVSKSFTAALMSMMVDEGKVRWEDKVKDILPEFELFDKEIEAEVETIAPYVSPESKTFKVTLKLKGDTSKFRPGMYVQISMVYKTYEDVLVLDQRTRNTDGSAYWYDPETQTANYVVLDVIAADNTKFVIDDKWADTLFIVDGQGFVLDGQKVNAL